LRPRIYAGRPLRKPDEFLLTKVTTQLALLDKMDQVAEQRVFVAVEQREECLLIAVTKAS